MGRSKTTGTAFRNMMLAVFRDPVWAISAIVLSPLRVIKALARQLIVLFAITLVIGTGATLGLQWLGAGESAVAKLALNIGLSLLFLVVLFKMISNSMVMQFGNTDSDAHGTARFAGSKDLRPLRSNRSGLLIGRDPKSRQFLHYDGQAHLLTMAPTRTGKGVGTIIPNLLTAERSIICIDPKGENTRATIRTRNRIGSVHVLDPFAVTGLASASFNPLAKMDLNDPDIVDDVAVLADTLVFDDQGSSGDNHWNEEAKGLIAGLILRIVACETEERRNLSTLREYLTSTPDDFSRLLEAMQKDTRCNGLIARAANRQLGKAEREASGVVSTAQRHTHFLDSARMSAVLQHSSFDFATLKEKVVTVFLVLPPDRLSNYARWLRLIIGQSLTVMSSTKTRPAKPVLYLLDEFASLGYLAPIERAMGLMAGYDVQLWPILQDIHQLQATYGRRAGTFLSNSGVLQVFGVNDRESARLVSDLLGQETVVFSAMARTLGSIRSDLSVSQHHSPRPLLTPDEVRTLSPDAQLLFLSGQRPILAGKLVYFRDREFAGLYDPS